MQHVEVYELLIRLGSLTSPNNLAVQVFFPRDGSMENSFGLRICMALSGLHNVVRLG